MQVTRSLVGDCHGRLVQASRRNKEAAIRAIDGVETKAIANLTLGLTTAFEMLGRGRSGGTNESAGCNEAIMLVTDGVDSDEDEVFEKYNNNSGEEEEAGVRVFTYFINHEQWSGGVSLF